MAGTGTPPTTPNLGLPRYSGADPADYPTQTNAITDLLDTKVAPRRVAVTAQPILDVGVLGQVRAGRQLTAADFTALGLSAPLGLWNLSDLTDASGNGRALTNKGAVPFGPGINGAASTAAVFAGSTAQALYISDTGAADPFRIRMGSWGCWCRVAKRSANEYVLAKHSSTAYSWALIGNNGQNVAGLNVSTDGTSGTLVSVNGVSDIADDRWHFLVATHDGTTARLYVDGVLEAAQALGLAASVAAPVNIGAFGADGSTAASAPYYGRVDEAFVTNDVLSDDQIRALYCAKIAHGFTVTPTVVNLAVRRARKGGPLAPADFPTAPLRLHNFTAGALTDQGSGGVALTIGGGAVSVVGADGTQAGAYNFNGTSQSLSSTDAGLPSGLAARSYGCWFKTTKTAVQTIFVWGTIGTGADEVYMTAAGVLTSVSGSDVVTGPFVADGQWHYFIAVEDNAAGDGVKHKLYLDGRLVGGSTAMGTLVLAGAGHFCLGIEPPSAALFTGQVDGAFVCDYALTQDAISKLYAKSSQALSPSPKNAGDHVESADASSLDVVFDTLDSQHTIDLGVSG